MRQFFIVTLFASALAGVQAGEEGLIGHWPLSRDARDVSGRGSQVTPHDVDFRVSGPHEGDATAAGFNGRSSSLEIAPPAGWKLGTASFSVSAWVHVDGALDDAPGDIISQYDPQSRRGFQLSLKTNGGVTFSQPNTRQLQFGIDNNQSDTAWHDCGRPGNALLAFGLCVYNGGLYVGTCEPGRDEAGHVYSYVSPDRWIDRGAPDRSNAVTALAEFDGELYAATGKYRVAGSSLAESENTTPGGRIFRYAGEQTWIDCGALPGAEAVGGLVVFQGQLYASSLYRPAGFYRYEGGQRWTDVGVPPRPADLPGETTTMRVEALGVYNGQLYATSYDGGRVFRFDGKTWTDCGHLGDNTQTYSFAILGGRLYVGTWPSGRVYRMEEVGRWTDVGRLGEELEVMGMLVHNGRLVAGTLPLAEVYQYEGGDVWTQLTRLDHTPDVRYRRAWAMAEFNGRVFCSTLPSGKIYSWRAGRVAMDGSALKPGWRHVAAVRRNSRDSSDAALYLYVDGRLVAMTESFQPADYDLTLEQPLRIGAGPNGYFNGRIADVRLYDRALSAEDVTALAQQ